MKTKIFSSFLILALILVFPQVNAQSDSFKEVSQKSLHITVDQKGNVSVVHEIQDAPESRQLNFVKGTVSNLEFIDKFGRTEAVDVDKEAKNIIILPNQGKLFVRYELDNALILKNDVWTWDYRYLQSTTFTVPEEVNLLFANQQPIFLDDKNGFVCHGCQVTLEYSINQPKHIKQVSWEDKEFLVEMKTFADIESFDFDQPAKEISFKINEDNRFVTTIIPLELLWEPYMVFLNGEQITVHNVFNNGTHVWLSMRPETSGEISIIGTTVVPEFPIIAPLAIGFLMITLVPFLRKVNLH